MLKQFVTMFFVGTVGLMGACGQPPPVTQAKEVGTWISGADASKVTVVMQADGKFSQDSAAEKIAGTYQIDADKNLVLDYSVAGVRHQLTSPYFVDQDHLALRAIPAKAGQAAGIVGSFSQRTKEIITDAAGKDSAVETQAQLDFDAAGKVILTGTEAGADPLDGTYVADGADAYKLSFPRDNGVPLEKRLTLLAGSSLAEQVFQRQAAPASN